jgi:hypothetical protein
MHQFSAPGAAIRHATTAVAEAALIVAIGVALVFGYAVATGAAPTTADQALARGGSAIWIDESSVRSTSNLRFGQSLKFGYRSDAATSIQLQCYQPVGSDRLVFSDFRMLFEGGLGYGEPFDLGPSAAWTDGAASCKAMLGHRSKSGRYMVEASLRFDVAP